jgi:hypothetical protein
MLFHSVVGSIVESQLYGKAQFLDASSGNAIVGRSVDIGRRRSSNRKEIRQSSDFRDGERMTPARQILTRHMPVQGEPGVEQGMLAPVGRRGGAA